MGKGRFYVKPRRHNRRPTDDSGAGFLAVIFGFMTAYLVAEAYLAEYVHPLHWGVAAFGAFAGWLLAVIFQKLRRLGKN